ncbi:hypothetical protein RJT34_00722 [Clitoria ternatea]|uniref:Uncharacterized protein n=1 Tax=Clitoria ternatea TaxID=43366 RepID=A0AAN9KIS9_CLITE
MLLHDSRNDDGIKSFFQEVHELYIKLEVVNGPPDLVAKMACRFLCSNLFVTLFVRLGNCRLFLIPCICLAPGSHHHILTLKSGPLHGSICRNHLPFSTEA